MVLYEHFTSVEEGESSNVLALKLTTGELVQASTEFGRSIEVALKFGPSTMKYATINFIVLSSESKEPVGPNSTKKSYR